MHSLGADQGSKRFSSPEAWHCRLHCVNFSLRIDFGSALARLPHSSWHSYMPLKLCRVIEPPKGALRLGRDAGLKGNRWLQKYDSNLSLNLFGAFFFILYSKVSDISFRYNLGEKKRGLGIIFMK